MGQRYGMQLEHQRGQTLPFWMIGVLIVLTMLFFLANYVNTLTWQIRAQNAADAAASTSLGIQSNLWNEETLVLYSTALDEYRIRYLNQALINTVEGVGGCQGPGACDADYRSLLAELYNAVAGYDKDVQMLSQANNFTEGGQQADQKKAESLIGSDCANTSDYTCQFTITPIDAGSTAGGGTGKITPTTQAEYVACKKISYFGPALLKLGNTTTYNVVGRGAAAVLPASTETFDPGTAMNPQTGNPYQPLEEWAQTYSGPAYDVNFSGLSLTLNWYTAATVRPYSGTLSASSYTCN